MCNERERNGLSKSSKDPISTAVSAHPDKFLFTAPNDAEMEELEMLHCLHSQSLNHPECDIRAKSAKAQASFFSNETLLLPSSRSIFN